MKSNIFIIFYLLLNAIIIVSSSSNATRIIDYYYEFKIYSIEEYENNYVVVIKEIIYCFRTPCNPLIIDIVSIKDKEDNSALKVLFDELFKNSDTKQKSLFDEELSVKHNEIITSILERNKILFKLEYKIINNLNQFNNVKYKEKGYSYEEEDDGVIYTIAMGEKPSSGYSIDVKRIKIIGRMVTIYVNEKIPGKDEVVYDMMTYPIVQIKFNQLPSQVTVLDYETIEQYPCLME